MLNPQPLTRPLPATPPRWALRALMAAVALALSGCAALPTALGSFADWHTRAVPAAAPEAAESVAKPAGAPTTADEEAATARDAAAAQWWAALGDPELPQYVQAALQASPSLAAAKGRIERARAERVAADAAWMPLVFGSASAQSGRDEPRSPLVQTTSLGAQASWEIDLFGAGRATSAAQAARLAGAEQAWQAVRLSVAADTGLSYVGLRACEAQHEVAQQDVESQAATVRATERAAEAGYLSSDQAALARAAAAQARAVLGARTAQCARLLQALATLTAMDEASLRHRLSARTGQMPVPVGALPEALPADLLMRRPDLQEAAQSVQAAGHDERAAQAARWPSVSLTGTLGQVRASSAPLTISGQVWTLGPLQITFPIFDAGLRQARVQVAQAHVDEAKALYQARVRKAAEEVEDALIILRSTREREVNARQAALSFGVALAAARQRLQGGMASVLEVEQTRRAAVAARAAVVDLQQSRANAWISLYRVLGGSWTAAASATADAPQRAIQPGPALRPDSPLAGSASKPITWPSSSASAPDSTVSLAK